jgi:F-type H+-transporting ATPase subunit b
MAPLIPVTTVLAAGGITDINPGLTVWTGITFVALLFVLKRFAWGPIIRTLDERERTIREAIDSAKKERAEAEKLLTAQKEALAQAQRDAADLARRNQQDMETLRQELTGKARKEAEDLLGEARRQITEELTRARAELKAEVVDLAIDAAGRLVRANLDDKAQRALVQEYLAQLPGERAS